MKSIVNYRTFRVASAILLLSVVSISATTHEQCDFKSLRLPQRVKPTHYDLLLRLPDLNAPTYEGQVKIDLIVGELHESCPVEAVHCSVKQIFCKKPVPFGCDQKEIILNANSGVTIKGAEFVVDGDGKKSKTIKSHDICQDAASGMAAIRFNKRIKDNSRGRLIIHFQAQIGSDEKTDGIYKSTLKSSSGRSSYVSIVSHFDPSSARKAFPCFDEPMFKSTFDVAIEHRKGLTALANTKAIGEEPVEGQTHLVRTRFERTPIMSTYLLAVAVGKYDHIESELMDQKMLIRVFTPPGQQEMGRTALDIGRRAYAAFREYFDIEQPIEKIDLLPVKMASGAGMENWGLVTFQDNLLLVNDEEAKDNFTRTQLAGLMGHALAHHWFGNLVTMKWWDNTWLYEAFAQWIGYKMADEIYPELNVDVYLVERIMAMALESDAVPSFTHPLKILGLEKVKDIKDSLDSITYYKGAAIFRMLEAYLGKETFKLAIRDYVNKFKYQNADETDLWNALEARSNEPVARIMWKWLMQPGFPQLDVQLTDNNRIFIRQSKFGGKPNKFGGLATLWSVPVQMVIMRADKPEVVKFMLTDREELITLPDWFDASKGHWFKLNHNAEGFFRVQYPPYVMKMMHQAIKSKQMNLLDRMNVLDDTRALYITNKVDLATVNEVLSSFEGERDPLLSLMMAKLQDIVAQKIGGSPDKYPILTSYFDEVIMRDTKKVWDPTILDIRVLDKKDILLTLISINYGPAVEYAREGVAEMAKEGNTNWPKLKEFLKKYAN